LIACSVVAVAPNHPVVSSMVKFLADTPNHVKTGAAWKTVGPGLLTDYMRQALPHPELKTAAFPFYSFVPYHHKEKVGDIKPDELPPKVITYHSFAMNLWGSTFQSYKNLGKDPTKRVTLDDEEDLFPLTPFASYQSKSPLSLIIGAGRDFESSLSLSSRGFPVLAFDPFPANLRRFTELHEIPENLKVVPLFLSDKQIIQELVRTQDQIIYPASFTTNQIIAEKIEVETQTLDQWATASQLDDLSLLIVDSPGWEFKILRGASGILYGLSRTLRIEVSFNAVLQRELGEDPLSFLLFMSEHGYIPYLEGERIDREDFPQLSSMEGENTLLFSPFLLD